MRRISDKHKNSLDMEGSCSVIIVILPEHGSCYGSRFHRFANCVHRMLETIKPSRDTSELRLQVPILWLLH